MLVYPCLAPMPPCSPFILINKIVESTNILSDIHPYYPIPPCPHGGPLQAISKGDFNSVFIKDVPGHLWYELSWLLAVGLPRKLGVITGKYPFKFDPKILTEGYKHKTRFVRNHFEERKISSTHLSGSREHFNWVTCQEEILSFLMTRKYLTRLWQITSKKQHEILGCFNKNFGLSRNSTKDKKMTKIKTRST